MAKNMHHITYLASISINSILFLCSIHSFTDFTELVINMNCKKSLACSQGRCVAFFFADNFASIQKRNNHNNNKTKRLHLPFLYDQKIVYMGKKVVFL